jgi:hypothetical protein
MSRAMIEFTDDGTVINFEIHGPNGTGYRHTEVVDGQLRNRAMPDGVKAAALESLALLAAEKVAYTREVLLRVAGVDPAQLDEAMAEIEARKARAEAAPAEGVEAEPARVR